MNTKQVFFVLGAVNIVIAGVLAFPDSLGVTLPLYVKGACLIGAALNSYLLNNLEAAWGAKG